jgi:cyclopropane-fatty-acyl-phospholipid synthase
MKRDQASDFMNKEIYPDSDLPFLAEVVAAVDGLFEVVAVRNDRLDYARSYDGWGANLRRRRDEAVSMVGEEQVRRFERFFKLGSIGFRMGKLGLLRFTLRPITKNWTLTGSERWGAARLRLV